MPETSPGFIRRIRAGLALLLLKSFMVFVALTGIVGLFILIVVFLSEIRETIEEVGPSLVALLQGLFDVGVPEPVVILLLVWGAFILFATIVWLMIEALNDPVRSMAQKVDRFLDWLADKQVIAAEVWSSRGPDDPDLNLHWVRLTAQDG